MEQTWIVKVAVSAVPYAVDRPYDYVVPEKFRDKALPGVRVIVPFGRGNQKHEGVILSAGKRDKDRNLKAVLEVLDPAPVLDAAAISLALWMRQRYFCTVFDAFRAMLPAGFWYHTREIWHIADPSGADSPGDHPVPDHSTDHTPDTAHHPPDANPDTAYHPPDANLNAGHYPPDANPPAAVTDSDDPANPEETAIVSNPGEAVRIPRNAEEILTVLRERGGKLSWTELRNICGDVHASLRMMERAGLVWCETVTRRNAADKTRPMAELALPPDELMDYVSKTRRTQSMRYEVVKFLSAAGRASCADISYYTGADLPYLRKMAKDGLLLFTAEEEFRLSAVDTAEESGPVELNDEQRTAFEQIRARMDLSQPGVTLLRGVTGSGKTLVYLHLVRETLERGKTAVVLVPEIVLTPQMMRKFTAWFGDHVAMLHSSLRLTERYDQWKRIRNGIACVALGTRSAIFAPLRNIGLIVIDEEQEDTYRSGNTPRYDAREIAKYLCARDGAALVLGSATPSVESAWNAEQGVYQNAILRRRYNQRSLPEVLIADLREELRAGNSGVISAPLRAELERNFAAGEQSILFLNRRGHDRMLLCGECGHVPECPRCSVSMTYHSANNRLMCHHCGYSQPAPEQCPVCGGIMKHIGAGTQKVEEELRTLYPEVEILRMDMDTAAGKQDKLLSRFEKERVPILLGTQMVAKGLDFENVTLTGVLQADLSLYMDHYRAAERTFSLLTQVAGRSGRGAKAGRAVIQTWTPESDIIQAAAAQNYERFYESEIRMRRVRGYPPFADLFTLTVSGIEEGAVMRGAVRVRDMLRILCEVPELADPKPQILGPAPAPILKINRRYRYRVLLTGKNNKTVRQILSRLCADFFHDRINRGLALSIDCNGAG